MSTLTSTQVFSSMCQHCMGSERQWRPSFLSFVCILHAKGVSGASTGASILNFVCILHAKGVSSASTGASSLYFEMGVVVGEGSSRLNILLGSPPLSLFDMLLAIGGVFRT